MSSQTLYLDGKYLAKNPGWHVEESPWKAKQVLRMLRQNHLAPTTVCDVGCGTDYFYTPRSIKFASEPGEKALTLPRKLCFAIHRDFAVRLLGGFSLLVLAR